MSFIKFPSSILSCLVAPVVLALESIYFVTEGSGKTLTYYSELPAQHPDDDSLQDMVTHIFYIFGKTLGQLHDYGLSHGRPAMRDITYDPDTDKVTLLDWEMVVVGLNLHRKVGIYSSLCIVICVKIIYRFLTYML